MRYHHRTGSNSITPSTPDERRTTLIGHSIVNGLGVAAICCMHIWGELDANMAVGVVGAICGLWGLNTRKGPPGAAPGVSGLLLSPMLPSLLGRPWG